MENIGRKIGWKTVFSTVWQKKENGKEGKPGRKFSLSSSQNSSSQIRRKRLERKCSHNTFTKILSPNIYNNSAWHNKKKEAKNNHPTTKPSTTTKHRNLAQKINPKSTEKQLENPTQNQDKPTGKPNSKSIKTHGETQPKIITDTPQNHQNRSKSRSKFIKPIYKFI